jgi:hypothetical protein
MAALRTHAAGMAERMGGVSTSGGSRPSGTAALERPEGLPPREGEHKEAVQDVDDDSNTISDTVTDTMSDGLQLEFGSDQLALEFGSETSPQRDACCSSSGCKEVDCDALCEVVCVRDGDSPQMPVVDVDNSIDALEDLSPFDLHENAILNLPFAVADEADLETDAEANAEADPEAVPSTSKLLMIEGVHSMAADRTLDLGKSIKSNALNPNNPNRKAKNVRLKFDLTENSKKERFWLKEKRHRVKHNRKWTTYFDEDRREILLMWRRELILNKAIENLKSNLLNVHFSSRYGLQIVQRGKEYLSSGKSELTKAEQDLLTKDSEKSKKERIEERRKSREIRRKGWEVAKARQLGNAEQQLGKKLEAIENKIKEAQNRLLTAVSAWDKCKENPKQFLIERCYEYDQFYPWNVSSMGPNNPENRKIQEQLLVQFLQRGVEEKQVEEKQAELEKQEFEENLEAEKARMMRE